MDEFIEENKNTNENYNILIYLLSKNIALQNEFNASLIDFMNFRRKKIKTMNYVRL